MKKKGYWSEIEDKLCSDFILADKRSEKYTIYKQLYPKFEYMIRSIMHRYFSISSLYFEDFFVLTLSHVFLKLDGYNEKKRGKNGWYSYVQTLAKNYLIDLVKKQHSELNAAMTITNRDEKDVYELEISDNNHYENSKLKDTLIEHFENKINIVKKNIIKHANVSSERFLNSLKKEIIYLELLIDFIIEHDNYTIANFIEYLYHSHSDKLKRLDIVTFTNKYLNRNMSYNKFNELDKEEGR